MGLKQENITSLIERAANQYAERPAFACLGHNLTYGDVERLSKAFAAWLQNESGLQPGDRVAVQMANILQYPVVVYGVLRAGMILVNVNPLYTPREIRHQLKDSGARLLVIMANLADRAAAVIQDTSVTQVVITEIADLHPPIKRLAINAIIRYVKRMVPSFQFPQQIGLRDVLRSGSTMSYQPVDAQVHDIAVLQYTGGTTGVAKGAVLTHANLTANTDQVGYLLKKVLTPGKELFVSPLPLYHIYAFMIHCLFLPSLGACSLLIPNPRDLNALVKDLEKVRFTGFCGLNTLFNGLCRHKGFRSLDFSALKLTTSGGMALTTDVAHCWQRVTGCEILEGYGLTETSPVVAFNPPGSIRIGSIGCPIPFTDIRLIDEQGRDVSNGCAGELLVRGPQVMQGYWQQPEETRKVLSEDGWLATGDIAERLDDGYLRIVDRKKDMIIVSGFNVYPNEVEEEVCKHPGITEAAAIGIPDPAKGEVVKLYAVTDDSTLTEDEVLKFCRLSLTPYKVPSRVEFVSELPKSVVGKVIRRELREHHQKSQSTQAG